MIKDMKQLEDKLVIIEDELDKSKVEQIQSENY